MSLLRDSLEGHESFLSAPSTHRLPKPPFQSSPSNSSPPPPAHHPSPSSPTTNPPLPTLPPPKPSALHQTASNHPANSPSTSSTNFKFQWTCCAFSFCMGAVILAVVIYIRGHRNAAIIIATVAGSMFIAFPLAMFVFYVSSICKISATRPDSRMQKTFFGSSIAYPPDETRSSAQRSFFQSLRGAHFHDAPPATESSAQASFFDVMRALRTSSSPQFRGTNTAAGPSRPYVPSPPLSIDHWSDSDTEIRP